MYIVPVMLERQKYTAEPVLPDPGRLEVDIATAKLTSINSQVVIKLR
jgi:hypothetical protein